MVLSRLLVLLLVWAPGVDLFEQLYERGRAQEKDLNTLRARFTETTVSTLLKRPIVATGSVVAMRPIKVRLDYETPERKTVLIDRDRLVVVWPEREEREDLQLTELQRRVDRYFTRASLEDLRGHFDVNAEADPELAGSYRIVFLPKRKQIRQGLEQLEIWVERESLMMLRMRMSFPGGDSKTFELAKVERNPSLDPSVFTVPAR